MRKTKFVRLKIDCVIGFSEELDSVPYVGPDVIADALMPVLSKIPHAQDLLPGMSVDTRLDFRKQQP